MRRFFFRHAPHGLAIGLVCGALMTGVSTQAQTASPARAAAKSVTSRSTAATPAATTSGTVNYERDLQGRWNFATATPWERPAGTPLELDEKDVKEFQKKLEAQCSHCDDHPDDPNQVYNGAFFEMHSNVMRVNGKVRSSLVVDPPDGKIPPLIPGVREKLAAIRKAEEHAVRAADFSTVIRCIIGFNTGPPLTPGTYGNNVEIVQNSDYVVMTTEHVHAARVFPVDGRPHTGIRQYLGDSVGHWEGNTLVVDSINFLNGAGITVPNLHGHGNGPRAHVIERFTRIEKDTLLYSFTIEDPDVWTKPWTMEFTFRRDNNEAILEYACHESNYAIRNSLSELRALEKKEAASAQKK